MSVFDAYSAYYDLLYRDKDYAGESAYVAALIHRHRPGSKRIVELGSGTGRHALKLAEKGFSVHGVERSPTMLAVAQKHSKTFPAETASRVNFTLGSLESTRLGQRCDCAISLFHVFSYLTTNELLDAALQNVHAHLEPDGLLIFDAWYGPAVLTELPQPRVKRVEDDHIRVLRFTEPTIFTEENLVEVNYQVVVTEKGTEKTTFLQESHDMRYYFVPEVERALQSAGFRLRAAEEWLTGQPLRTSTFGVCFVAQRA